MKKIIYASLMLLALLCAGANAQDKPKADAPPQLTREQQQQLAQAVAAATAAQLQAEAAQAKLEAARATAQAVAFRVMALLKVSPDEFQIKQQEGGGFTLERKPPPAPPGR